MELEQFKTLQIGDLIEFRSTTRFGSRKAKRLITGFPKLYETVETWGQRSTEWVLVRFEGSPNFYVRRSEVIQIVKRNATAKRNLEALARWRSAMPRRGS